jgi:hypothetical protein
MSQHEHQFASFLRPEFKMLVACILAHNATSKILVVAHAFFQCHYGGW